MVRSAALLRVAEGHCNDTEPPVFLVVQFSISNLTFRKRDQFNLHTCP